MAGRVIRDAVREDCADVVDAELTDEELRQLEYVVGSVRLAQRAHARRRRRDDELVPGERLEQPARKPRGFGRIAAVQMHLAATRLLRREDDLVPEPLEHRDRGAGGLGRERVGETRYEERDAQTSETSNKIGSLRRRSWWESPRGRALPKRRALKLSRAIPAYYLWMSLPQHCRQPRSRSSFASPRSSCSASVRDVPYAAIS